MIVGPGPTSRDDTAGESYSGSTGKLLRSMLADAGFEPQDVFYSQAVRCGGVAPTPAEIDACRPWLAQDIAEVQPEAIIALGDPALRALTKLAGLQSKRGQSYKLHASFGRGTDEIVWPTYAPGYVALYPQARHVVVADLRRVRDRTKQAEEIPWEWWDGSPLPPGPYGFDIETDYDRKTKTGGDNMIQCAVATLKHGAFVAYGPEQARLLALQLDGEAVFTLNGWNFDNPKCHSLGISVPHGIDVMALAYLDDETQPLGLESLAVKYLGVRGWKDLREATPGTNDFALYNAKDSHYTLLLASKLRQVLGERTRLVTHVMSPARLALDVCTERGIPLNAVAIQRARDSYIAALHSRHDAVIQLGGKHNPNSTAEVAEILQARGIVLRHTPTGKYATDKSILQDNGADGYAASLLSYREARKALSTYVEPYERAVQSTGRVHPEYTIWRTVTNRTSARNPNIQNLPRNLKDFFNVTSVDYSSIEFRLAAWVAGETGILERFAINPDWDPHLFFAMELYGDAIVPTANLLALRSGVPTDRSGAEVLRVMSAFFGKSDKAPDICAELRRTGWRGIGELSAQERSRSPFIREREQLLQEIGETGVRRVRNWLDVLGWEMGEDGSEPTRSSYRPRQIEQYSFQSSDAMQALSSAASYFLESVDPKWKNRRQVAKSGNFSQLFMGNGQTLQDYAGKMGIVLSLRECNNIHHKWHTTFPAFRRFYRQTLAELMEHGYAETATGYRRHYGDIRDLSSVRRAAALREAVNVKVQTLAAHVALIGLAECHRQGLPVCGFIHDANLFDFASRQQAVDAMPLIEYCMIEHPVHVLRDQFGVDLNVPLIVEATYPE